MSEAFPHSAIHQTLRFFLLPGTAVTNMTELGGPVFKELPSRRLSGRGREVMDRGSTG